MTKNHPMNYTTEQAQEIKGKIEAAPTRRPLEVILKRGPFGRMEFHVYKKQSYQRVIIKRIADLKFLLKNLPA